MADIDPKNLAKDVVKELEKLKNKSSDVSEFIIKDFEDGHRSGNGYTRLPHDRKIPIENYQM